MNPITTPESLSINAWTGDVAPAGRTTSASERWALLRRAGGPCDSETYMLPREVDERDWRDPEVGWGVVLPENEAVLDHARFPAGDAPPAIQELVASRGPAPVLRYRPDGMDGYLRRYDKKGGYKDFSLVGSKPGVGPDRLPRYLLIAAGPEAIPWQFQYAANLSHYVGRLPLTGDALDTYVRALLSDWAGMETDSRAPLVWSVNHGHPDITSLMESAISKKLADLFESDPAGDLHRHTAVFGPDATIERLALELIKLSPSLVVTTSHGMTGPVSDPAALIAQLGSPVDATRRVLEPSALLTGWSPNGAIWYSHACCSAGSDAPSCYRDLLDADSPVTQVLDVVAAASGRRVAPLPEHLLGAKRPVRAFVGHVEPTFDYTLRDPSTGQPLTHTLCEALYNRLYGGSVRTPIAWALKRVFDDSAAMWGLWARAVQGVNRNEPGARAWALYRQLTALDRQHTVILGDPAVSLPAISA
jgi:hypothetical protein